MEYQVTSRRLLPESSQEMLALLENFTVLMASGDLNSLQHQNAIVLKQSVTLDFHLFTGLAFLTSYNCIMVTRKDKLIYQGQMRVMVPFTPSIVPQCASAGLFLNVQVFVGNV